MNSLVNAAPGASADDGFDPFDPFAGGALAQVVPATEAQREIWLAAQLGTEASLAFNESVTLRLTGALDREALQHALDALLARHAVLRATFSPDGSQLLIAEPAGVPLAVRDLRALPPQALQSAGTAAVSAPMDLQRGPLLHAHLWRLADDEHLLALVAHHAVCDGWSWGVLIQDLGQLYRQALGQGPAPAAGRGFADYALWEAAEAQGPAQRANIDFWVRQFTGSSLPVLELPLDRPRPAVRTFASERLAHLLPADLAAALRKAASSAGAGVSLYGVLLAGFAALLHRLTAQDDLVIGIAAAGQMAADMPEVVGHCVNTLPLRLAVDGQQPFAALAQRTGSQLLDAFEHQSLTYAALLRELQVPREASRLPLVSVLFNVDTAPPTPPDFPGLAVQQDSLPRVSENFELFVNIAPAADGLRVEIQFNRDLFDAPTVARWLRLYEALLRSGAETPALPVGQLQWLQPADLAQLQALQPAATPAPQPALMHSRFVAQAAATPERIALWAGDTSMRYGELDALSNRLARALRARGVRRGVNVGLHLPRNAGMLVALLGVLKAGGAYVPLDPDFPAARLHYYAEDAGIALLLTDSSVHERLSGENPSALAAVPTLVLDTDTAWMQAEEANEAALPPSADDATPDDPAYLIYTSGSTGKPKGVVVPHGGVANFLLSMHAAPGISADDRLLAISTLSFDVSVLELMLPLEVGAQVILATRETALDAEQLAALIALREATVMQATPSQWRLLMEIGWRAPRPMRALIGAEPLPPDLAHALLAATGELWNLYGPTETTVWCTRWRVDAGHIGRSGVSIGTPIDNMQVWVLDERQQPLPLGVPGELYISGAGMTQGYLNRPELNAERFIEAAPFGQPLTLYRTGDRGRWNNAGLLEHLGRLDFQVKVRGYRIELGEIEARCNEAPGVLASVVVTREDQAGDVRLVAYLALAEGHTLDRAVLGRHLRDTLPQYMLPQHVVALRALPLMPNGKVDRKALPAPQAAAPTESTRAAEPGRPPRNACEATVLQAMEQVLRMPGLRVGDDFFAMGGHSLLAARLAAQLGQTFGLHLPLGLLFQAPTAEALAAEIERAQGAGDTPPIVIARRARPDLAPLTLEQARMRFAQELHPDTTAFNTPTVLRLRGPLQRAHFEAALHLVVARQDVLRTALVPQPDATDDTDAWAQHIAPELPVDLPCEDLRGVPAGEREAQMRARVQAEIDAPIASDALALWRCGLYQLGEEEHVFLFMPHHLIWDGYSFDILYRELAAYYGALVAGEAPAPAPLALRYGDFAQWQADWLATPAAERQRRYWRERLARAPVMQPLAPDHRLKPGQLGTGQQVLLQLPAALSATLREIAQARQLTLNTVLMSAWAAALARRAGRAEVALCLPVRGRPVPALDEVMGFFIGLAPLMLNAAPGTGLLDLAAQAREELSGALANQDLPWQELLAQASPAQRRAGLYQCLFSFQDLRDQPAQWGRGPTALRHEHLMLFQKGLTDDLGLWLMDGHDGLSGYLAYNADRFDTPTVEAIVQDFTALLEQLAQATNAPKEAQATPEAGVRVQALPQAQVHGTAAPAVVHSSAPEAADADWSEAQRTLARIWSEVLGIDAAELRLRDNFFDLGGDSLLAMRAARQAQAALGFVVQPRRYVYEDLGRIADPALGQAAEAARPSRPGLLGRLFGGIGRNR